MLEDVSVDVEMSLYVLRSLEVQFPKEFATASKIANRTIEKMERNGMKLKPHSIEEVCYWVNLATYAYLIIDGLKEEQRYGGVLPEIKDETLLKRLEEDRQRTEFVLSQLKKDNGSIE